MSEKSPKCLIDLTSQGLRIEYDEYHTLDAAFLMPIGTTVRWLGNSLHTELIGEPLELLRLLEKAHSSMPPLNASCVVFGRSLDPFQQGISGFSAVLQVLEYFAARRPERLVFQTRSPLILALIPILRMNRIEVSVGFDCPDDRSRTLVLPETPRTSDRLGALHALRRAGITASAQLFPHLQATYPLAKARAFARELGRSAGPVLLLGEDGDEFARPSGCRAFREAGDVFEKIFALEQIPFRRPIVKANPEVLREAA